ISTMRLCSGSGSLGRRRSRENSPAEMCSMFASCPANVMVGRWPRMAKKQQRRRKATRAATAKRKAVVQAVITIRAMVGGRLVTQNVLQTAPLQRLAEEWTYILRSRTRWSDDPDLRLSVRDRALRDLEHVGVPLAFLKKLATASHVEVELHPWSVDDT